MINYKAVGIIILGIIIVVISSLKLQYISRINHPGHADYSFYFTVAENIANNRGLILDYVWHYLSGFVPIHHPSNDYWMPLTSLIMSLAMSLLGPSLQSALVSSIIFSTLIAVNTYLISRHYTSSNFVQVYSSLLVLFYPSIFKYSILTDSTIYYVFFVMICLYYMIKGIDDVIYLYLSAVLAGLCYMTRQDGLLIVVILGACILISHNSVKTKVLTALISLIVYLATLSPYLLYNYKTFGKPFLSASSKTMFITDYEQIYSATDLVNFKAYFSWGWRNILTSKLNGLIINWKNEDVGLVVGLISLVGIILVCYLTRRDSRLGNMHKYLIPWSYMVVLVLFYSFVATFPGIYALGRSFLAVIPFVIIIAVSLVDNYIKAVWVKHLILSSSLIISLILSLNKAEVVINVNNTINNNMTSLGDIIRRDALFQKTDNIVVMTRNPWEFYHTTRISSIQIPNDDLGTIYNVAKKYDATHLILPGKRKALESIYKEHSSDLRFKYVGQVAGTSFKVFRFNY